MTLAEATAVLKNAGVEVDLSGDGVRVRYVGPDATTEGLVLQAVLVLAEAIGLKVQSMTTKNAYRTSA